MTVSAFNLSLATDQSTLIILANPGLLSDLLVRCATTSTAPVVRCNGNNLLVRSSVAGTFTTTLDSGLKIWTVLGKHPLRRN